ncbi:hypothetical protein AC249_AIPGENE27430 [Exaiptasia diaphana]|nr:hypothetical protein AC249_AIPGENE27430 [Exaiptasia diaphana]
MNSKLIVIVLMLVLLTTLHESDAWRRRRRSAGLNKIPRRPFAKEDAKEHANNRAYEDEIYKDLMKKMDID